MIYWALMFLLVAFIAAVFGFTGIALAAAGIAKLLFFIFLVLFVITFATHLTRQAAPESKFQIRCKHPNDPVPAVCPWPGQSLFQSQSSRWTFLLIPASERRRGTDWFDAIRELPVANTESARWVFRNEKFIAQSSPNARGRRQALGCTSPL